MRALFLLVLVTASLLKGVLFTGPGGNVAMVEFDLYHPLPDYKRRFSQFKLGEIAPPPFAPSMSPTTSKIVPIPLASPDSNDHHHEHEVSQMELQEYLKTHPETWVPLGYSKDRSDRFPQKTYSPYRTNQLIIDQQSVAPTSIPQKSKYLQNELPNTYNIEGSGEVEPDHGFVEQGDKYNISNYQDWEHYYHYREKRDLFHTLEHAFEESHNFRIKPCIMRAICEARSYLPPKGRSMMFDVIRIFFSIPLKDELTDDYSKAMRNGNMDCHEAYRNECSVSILYLILFGKFSS
ncbi:uncharacterized protein LOC134220889 isoform X2 [Armigeres subalbatus]|uniref:uncharacterized protein LOC134220889 isoform X2 n=1 Tax=Armigeres subalbatus TaxID=124917 RepID=UPI002ED147D1